MNDTQRSPIINVKNLTRKFKDFTAVNAVSFDVFEGEIFGFLGPNGAGKTTTINMLSTLLKISGGEATINGKSVSRERTAVRKSIGLVFQESTLDEDLTARENLRFHAEFYGLQKDLYASRSEELLSIVDLSDRADEVVKNFSGGMKRRLEIARGILHHPKVLFLDEPTIGLDPQTRSAMWQYIRKVAKQNNITVFMTTHYLNEAEYCDRIAVMDKGKIVALDTPNNLKKLVGGDIITLATSDNVMAKKEIETRFHVEVRQDEDKLVAVVENGNELLPTIIKELPQNVLSIELKEPTLDDVFIKLTGSKIREQEVSNVEKTKRFLRKRGRM